VLTPETKADAMDTFARSSSQILALLRHSSGPIHLSAQDVLTVHSLLRACVDRLSAERPNEAEFPFRVERIGPDGLVCETLAVATELVLAEAAFDEAMKTPGQNIRLVQGALEIATSN
jgi:hypothetical protein